MAFIRVTENTFEANLVDTNRLSKKSFNPVEYSEPTSKMKVKLDKLSSIADLKKSHAKIEGSKRLFSRGIDRVTGEVIKPTSSNNPSVVEKCVNCVQFCEGDILFHKISARIGKIGLVDFDGYGENEILPIKPISINPYYLLLALRMRDVLVQLPFRETARPRIKRPDIEKLLIPRIGDKEEEKIGEFLKEIFALRKRARTVFNGLLDNFDMAITAKLPVDYSFLVENQSFCADTLDPGDYFIKAVSVMFPKHEVLDNAVRIRYPPSLNAGENATALTLNDYAFEGIIPQSVKSVDQIYKKNFAKPSDIILNRLQSSEERVAKATVVLDDLEYLELVGLNLDKSSGKAKVPIYDQLFILEMKTDKLSPYYLSVVFNSRLFQYMFLFLMSGSTGRQRLRKSKLKLFKFPILSDHMMRAFSEATRISMEVFSETLRMLIALTQEYEAVIRGESPISSLTLQIEREKPNLSHLKGNCVSQAEKELWQTSTLDYPMNKATLA